MRQFTTTAAAAALVAGSLAMAAPAFADPIQFALVGGTALSYNQNTGVLKTPTAGDSETLTFPVGSTAYNLFPNGISVNVKITASKDGALQYQPVLGQSASNPKVLEYQQNLDNTDVTVTYTGAPVVVNHHTILTTGEVIIALSDVDSELTGDSLRPGKTGSSAIGITFSYDAQPPASTSGDYTGGGFFDYTPNSDTVVEDSFTFTDSSARGVLGGTTGPYVSSGLYYIKSFSFSPNGNFSANPVPTVVGVPEPVSWSLMLVGVGMVGAFARRRTAASIAA
jgi:hypothetical protein